MVFASMLEAKPFVQGMSMQHLEKKPFALYQKDNMMLVISGVGKANAAMATAYCCFRYQPACVLNLGAAGAAAAAGKLGDVFQINRVIEPDRIEITTDKTPVYELKRLKGFSAASLSTRDIPVITTEDRKNISEIANLMDMEGAAIVQACQRFNTPCILFKFVSDTPEHTKDGHIVQNIRKFRTPFYEYCRKFILPVVINSSREFLQETGSTWHSCAGLSIDAPKS